MAKTNSKKKQRQQKKKQKNRQGRETDHGRKEKSEFYYHEALWYIDSENFTKAETLLKRALKRDPGNREKLITLARLGYTTNQDDLVLESLLELYKKQLLDNTPEDNDFLLMLCSYLLHDGQHQTAKTIAEDIASRLKNKEMKVTAKKAYQKKLSDIIYYADQNIYFENLKRKNRVQKSRAKEATSPVPAQTPAPAPEPSSQPAKNITSEKSGRFQLESMPTIPITIHMEQKKFPDSCFSASPAEKTEYDLVLEAMQIRLKETFDHLLCLNSLQGITSFLYQEETARKVLKSFRGRALLADEVGMGKTIEAGLVLKEYILRQMVKNFLILTPTPLVSQWREELRTKFDLDFRSTDDTDFRAEGDRFWEHPFIVASINIAKSQKHFSAVTAREYDIVIIDEAHHLKNRTTLNWKLVNTLKKRFLLLLTATPVENNLMELYNLITLLKPGQLNTASAFKDEFMTRGDPTDPQNRSKLRGLLDQVMIRNTRAVANINIPPRFAETIRINPTAHETELYHRITGLVHNIKNSGTSSKRMILKHLLAEAGSSPAAVEKNFVHHAGKKRLYRGSYKRDPGDPEFNPFHGGYRKKQGSDQTDKRKSGQNHHFCQVPGHPGSSFRCLDLAGDPAQPFSRPDAQCAKRPGNPKVQNRHQGPGDHGTRG